MIYSFTQRIFNGIQAVEDTIREEFFPQIIPNMFYRIQFRAVRRLLDEPDEAPHLAICVA